MKFRVYIPGQLETHVIDVDTYEEAVCEFEQALWEAGVLPNDENIATYWPLSGGRTYADILAAEGFVTLGEGRDLPAIEREE